MGSLGEAGNGALVTEKNQGVGAEEEAREWVRSKGVCQGDELSWLQRITYGFVFRNERGNYAASVAQLKLACDGAPLESGFDLDVSAALVELFQLCWAKCSCLPEGEDRDQNTQGLVRCILKCEEQKTCSRNDLLVHLDRDLLHKCELIKDAKQYQAKERKVNTRLFYKQNKFNLLAEESEGYAKLAVALDSHASLEADEDEDGGLKVLVQSLIGRFSLDPNRVVEVVLGALEHRPESERLWRLLGSFDVASVAHVLGHKFRGYAAERDALLEPEEGEIEVGKGERKCTTVEDSTTEAPPALYALAGRLVDRGLLKLDALVAHLSPKDSGTKDAHALCRDLIKQEADNIGKISLNSSKKRAAGSGAGLGVGGQDRTKGRVGQLDARNLDLDAKAMLRQVVRERVDGFDFHGQRLRLCVSALESEDYALSTRLLDYWERAGVSAAADDCIAGALCKAVTRLVKPALACLYPRGMRRRFDPDAARAAKGSREEMRLVLRNAELRKLLNHLGPHLSFDLRALALVCRLLRGCLCLFKEGEGGDRNQADAFCGGVLETCVLPSLCLAPANPAASAEVWLVLRDLPYERRFSLYGGWADKCEGADLLRAACKLARVETRRILRRTTAAGEGGGSGQGLEDRGSEQGFLRDLSRALQGDSQGGGAQQDARDENGETAAERLEAKRRLARLLAKCCHACPLPCLEVIVAQVESYGESMAAPIVEALRYLTPFGHDVLTYVVLTRLAKGGREKFKEDGTNVADWVEALAALVGLVARKFPKEVETKAIAQYVLNQLKCDQTVDLVVLRRLLKETDGVMHVDDISDNQVEMLAGGNMLKVSGLLKGERTQQMRLASRALRERLSLSLAAGEGEGAREGMDLGVPLLVMTAQQHNALMFSLLNPPLKLLGVLIDRCQSSFLQYSAFVRGDLDETSAKDLAAYAKLLPSVEDMSSLHGLEPEYVFHCHRPLMRALLLWSHAEALREEGQEEAQAEAEGKDGPLGSWQDLLGVVRRAVRDPKGLDLDLYATFWSLELSDLFFPKERYDEASQQVDQRVQQVDKALGKTDKDASSLKEERDFLETELKRIGGKRGSQREEQRFRKKLLERANIEHELEVTQRQREDLAALRRLGADRRRELREERERCRVRAKEAAACIAEAASKRWEGHEVDLERLFHHCVLPRVRMSEQDALYCGHFVNAVLPLCEGEGGQKLNSSKAWAYARLESGKLLGILTQAEAARLGIFLSCSREAAEDAEGSHTEALASLWTILANRLSQDEYTARCNAMTVLRRCVGRGLDKEPGFQGAKQAVLEGLAKVAQGAEEEDLKQMAKSLAGLIVGKTKKPAQKRKPAPAEQGKGLGGSGNNNNNNNKSNNNGRRGEGPRASGLNPRSPPFVPRGGRGDRDRDRHDHHHHRDAPPPRDRHDGRRDGGGVGERAYAHPNSHKRRLSDGDRGGPGARESGGGSKRRRGDDGMVVSPRDRDRDREGRRPGRHHHHDSGRPPLRSGRPMERPPPRPMEKRPPPRQEAAKAKPRPPPSSTTSAAGAGAGAGAAKSKASTPSSRPPPPTPSSASGSSRPTPSSERPPPRRESEPRGSRRRTPPGPGGGGARPDGEGKKRRRSEGSKQPQRGGGGEDSQRGGRDRSGGERHHGRKRSRRT